MGEAVIISKSPSVLVKPWEAATDRESFIINLSSYDKPLVGIPVTLCLVFDQPMGDPVESIKRGLAKALLYYYPMCGRLAGGATDGEVVLQCNGEGVSFVEASANCALKDVPHLEEPSVQEELAMFYPGGRVPGMLHPDPLLLMQVTVFRCGRFVVGLTWDHSIADGTGIGQFLQAVGELSRGLPSPSVIPAARSDDDGSLLGMPQITKRIFTLMYSLQPSPLVLRDISVPSSLISRIKQEFSSNNHQTTCSVFEVITAVLWQCRTRAVMVDPKAPTALVFVANARSYAGAKHGYYGNCFSEQMVMTTYGAVADCDVMDIIRMIQQAKDQISGQYSSSHSAHLDLLLRDAKSLLQLGYDAFWVTCWRNLGLEIADFGGGRPARVMVYTKDTTSIPGCVECLPWNNTELYSVTSLCVKEEHAGVFLRELDNFTSPRTSSVSE